MGKPEQQTPSDSSPVSHPPSSRSRKPLIILALATLVLISFKSHPIFNWRSEPSINLLQHTAEPSGPTFELKHIFHHNTDRPHGQAAQGRLDVTPQLISSWTSHLQSAAVDSDHDVSNTWAAWTSPLKFSVQPKTIRRLAERQPDAVEAVVEYANTWKQRNMPEMKSDALSWSDDSALVPNVSDRDTIITLAYMAANAYVDIPYTGDWTNVTSPWNDTLHIGWDDDGVRGHVFATDDESLIVISIKGTSAAVFDSGGETVPKDKINDNLLFSCCCARISYYWNTVCDCYSGKSYTCNQDCLERELYSKDRYYKTVLDVYRNVHELYPDAEIWVTGHSLGGGLASLLGRTYGLSAVTFEAPGEMLATRRMHLPQPPGVPRWDEHIWHFGHTADPIFMGLCNGAGSSCWVAGYAMETRCHSGLECVYDVVTDKGWHVSMLNHRIHTVIDDVILTYNNTPVCHVPEMCFDCFNWNFISEGNDEKPPTPTLTSSITSSSSSSTSTISLKPTHTSTDTVPVPPVHTTPGDNGDDDGQICKHRTWYGRCYEYGPPDKLF